MTKNAKDSNRQRELIPRALKTTIPLSEQHPMVVLTDALDWAGLHHRYERRAA